MGFTGAQPLDGGGIPISSEYSPQNNTFPAMQGADGAYVDAYGNASTAPVMSFIQPRVVQRGVAQTGSGAKRLSCSFSSANVGGNSIVVCLGVGDVEDGVTSFQITDTQGNVYTKCTSTLQGGTLESAIFFATGIKLGQNTITVNITGPTAVPTGISMKIYEVWGFIASVDALDQVAVGKNASGLIASTGVFAPVSPNEMAFTALAIGNVTTVTPASGWSANDGTIFPWGGNLGAFDSQYRQLSLIAPVTPQASLSLSGAWAMCCATFRTIILPMEGTVFQGTSPWVENLSQVGGSPISLGAKTRANSLPVVLPTDMSALPVSQSGTFTVAGTVTANVSNLNPNGQASMANSSPVVLPSNQVPASGAAFPSSLFPLGMFGFGSLIQPLSSLSSQGTQANINADAAAITATVLVGTNSGLFAPQTPDAFLTVTATASGNTAVWTPPSGAKFRLLRYLIEVTQDAKAASAADLAIIFEDATTPMGIGHSVFIPTASATTFGSGYRSGWVDLGGVGYRSITADNVLNVNLSFALTSGVVRVTIAGNSD